MKNQRQAKILEIISERDIETQEELLAGARRLLGVADELLDNALRELALTGLHAAPRLREAACKLTVPEDLAPFYQKILEENA